MEIEIVSNIEGAKKIWNELSPNKWLCDDWDFRYCFYKRFNHPLFFYVGKDGGKIIGFLPLQLNQDEKFLEFFGGGFMKDNHVYIKPGYEDYISQFYSAISQPTRLLNIITDHKYIEGMTFYKYKYIADISEMSSMKDYFTKRFKAKSRKNMRHTIESIEENNPRIVMNNFEDLDLMMDLNKNTFKERSSFNKPFRSEIFHDLLELPFEKYLLTFTVNGEKGSVTFAIKYKDIYTFINSGTNKEKFSDLGTYNICKNMEKAIELKSKIFDAGIGAGKWKEKWHLEKVPQYVFIK